MKYQMWAKNQGNIETHNITDTARKRLTNECIIVLPYYQRYVHICHGCPPKKLIFLNH